MITSNPGASRSVFVLDGRKVLLIFACFFGVIAAADGLLLYFAVSSWSGAETTSAYRAGQRFNSELEQAKAQEALGWSVEISMDRRGGDETALKVRLRDRDGAPLEGRRVTLLLRRPTAQREDRASALNETEPGRYAASFRRLPPGQWNALVEIFDGAALRMRRHARLIAL